MKRKYIFLTIILAFICLLGIHTNSYATDLDEIVSYVITVDPRMSDGTLDITYEVTWKVLDSTSEGPLSWVQIGTPNQNFDTVTALSDNIQSISKYNQSYVKVTFDREYVAGQQINFKYSIHQSYMYTLKSSNCVYKFTPAWFSDIKIDHMEIRWNASEVKTSDDNSSKSGNYLVWSKDNLLKGEKLTATIKYNKTAFGTLDSSKQQSTNINGMVVMALFILFIIIVCALNGSSRSGYYRHSGFYGGGYNRGFGMGYGMGYGRGPRPGPPPSHHSSCAHSSCASSSCASSSCACACAGSGRAGCSRKDFYGTNLTTEKLNKVMKK
jgi:hypothetical protein